jgi:hypothetical protein
MNNMSTYLFSYGHAGARWSLEIQAESPDDAKQRVSRLAFATYDGELVAKVPVSLGAPVRLGVTLRNWFHWLFGRKAS